MHSKLAGANDRTRTRRNFLFSPGQRARHPSSAGTLFAAPEQGGFDHQFKHVTGYGRPSRERAGKGGDSVVLLRERAHDEEHHEPEHELLLGRQRRGERVREDRHVDQEDDGLLQCTLS